MKNLPDVDVKWKAPGEYVGQCRNVFNILEQWDGKRWRAVPDAFDPKEKSSPVKLHFGPDDDAPNNPYAGDEAFLPR